jgi:hypothetical protein
MSTACRHCGASHVSCQNRRWLSGRCCCESCDTSHDPHCASCKTPTVECRQRFDAATKQCCTGCDCNRRSGAGEGEGHPEDVKPSLPHDPADKNIPLGDPKRSRIFGGDIK